MSSKYFKSERVLLDGRFKPATLAVEEGTIRQILDYSFPNSDDGHVVDFGEKLVLPGLVDTHVHINEPGRTEWEGFDTATQAAAAGGITTVVDMPLNCIPVTTTPDALAEKLTSLADKLWVDCGFWGGLVPESLPDLEGLIRAGVLGVKSFTIESGVDEFPMVEAEHLKQAMEILAKYDLPYLIHAELENEDVDEKISEQAGHPESYQAFLESRPKSWENDAISLLIDLMDELTKAELNPRVHVVHLSSSDAISDIHSAQDRGLLLTAETCPHYLALASELIPEGNTLYKCCRPIRDDENRKKLWQGLIDSTIGFIVSDHSPCTPRLKLIESGDLQSAWGGISSLQFGLPIIWAEAKLLGLSLEQVIEWMATKPAEFVGLGLTKGRLSIGYDADFIVFDEMAETVVTKDSIKYRHKVTPYEGRAVLGKVEKTFLRGNLIFESGRSVGRPTGKPILHELD